LSIFHSIAIRCESHGPRFRPDAPSLSDSSAGAHDSDLQRRKEQKRALALAARTFNKEPSKSMAALQGLGLVQNPATPESMAEFMKHTPGLDLRTVGEYLSKRGDWNSEVRKAFMDLFPFAGLPLVEALRMLLSTFRLPGEAQLIERLMESFAERYFASQPLVVDTDSSSEVSQGARWVPREKQFDRKAEVSGGTPEGEEEPLRCQMMHSDTIFVLSYSIIMLNTDLHNPHVKTRMKIEEYQRNNRGIDAGRSLPDFFLRDIYEDVRDDEIRMHGEAPPNGAELAGTLVDDDYWESIIRRSESIDQFSTTERLLSETPPGTIERDILQVIMDCAPLPVLSLCFESVPDASVSMQAMTGFQDLANISAYFEQTEAVNSLVRVMCQYFSRVSAAALSVRAQVALRAAQQCVAQFAPLFREAEWRAAMDVLLQLWALDLLPPHLTEFDDFSGTDGKPLESLCSLGSPFFSSPGEDGMQYGSGDGFLETLTRWFEDETRDSEDEEAPRLTPTASATDLRSFHMGSALNGGSDEPLPVLSSDPTFVHDKLKTFVAKSGFVELFMPSGLSRLPAESLQALARALIALSRPVQWTSLAPQVQAVGSAESGELRPADTPVTGLESWHELADPVFGLEVLTNMTCMPLATGQILTHVWPLVSVHFERLLQYVTSGGGSSEQQFNERLIVNTVRLCIRLIGNVDLVPTLLSLLQQLSRLPPGLFVTYSERVACGLLVLVREVNLPHTGNSVIFALLKRIAEIQSHAGACSAGMECLNYWLNDDQALSRLLFQQQLPELLETLEAFAVQDSTSASATALAHLSSLVPQLARGTRSLPKACPWQSLFCPVLYALAHVARGGSQKSSANAFVLLRRLLLERGTELSLPWEELAFVTWKECLEQVLLPLLQVPQEVDANFAELTGARQANAAQLVCRVVLTHLHALAAAPESFPVLFLRVLQVLVSEAVDSRHAREAMEEQLKNLLIVSYLDPEISALASSQHGESLLEATWGVVSPAFPTLRSEIGMILNPQDMEVPPESDQGAVGQFPDEQDAREKSDVRQLHSGSLCSQGPNSQDGDMM